MENIKIMLAIIGTALPFAASALTFLIKLIKNGKARSVLQNTLRITEALQPLIVQAEAFVNYSGKEKKEFVLTKANQYAIENRIRFDGEKTAELIDELVETTKRVNQRPKDKVAVNQVSPLSSASI